ncbi:MerR family transcriptional regulator [Priestia megaterium]|uniref:MerR family transcriptional regulator n=1 Tax=Priestia megaterium TaxID=1404 RepID=UPI000BFA209F|nr:MerR family transcriptional regulator [Priestia megaterium]PFR88880.1 hypothetical protein COK39_25555 [Priestia megaterium]
MDKNLGYFAKQAAEEVGTNPHTLRRWALELEKVGYKFSRNNKGKDGHRIFYQHDIDTLMVFRDLISQLQDYEMVAKLTLERIQEPVIDELSPIVNEENNPSEPVIVSFTEQELKQYTESIIEETSKKIAVETAKEVRKVTEETTEIIYKRMENLLEQRDLQLVHRLNDSMEQRKSEVAAAKEENKGWFQRLFGGKK